MSIQANIEFKSNKKYSIYELLEDFHHCGWEHQDREIIYTIDDDYNWKNVQSRDKLQMYSEINKNLYNKRVSGIYLFNSLLKSGSELLFSPNEFFLMITNYRVVINKTTITDFLLI